MCACLCKLDVGEFKFCHMYPWGGVVAFRFGYQGSKTIPMSITCFIFSFGAQGEQPLHCLMRRKLCGKWTGEQMCGLCLTSGRGEWHYTPPEDSELGHGFCENPKCYRHPAGGKFRKDRHDDWQDWEHDWKDCDGGDFGHLPPPPPPPPYLKPKNKISSDVLRQKSWGATGWNRDDGAWGVCAWGNTAVAAASSCGTSASSCGTSTNRQAVADMAEPLHVKIARIKAQIAEKRSNKINAGLVVTGATPKSRSSQPSLPPPPPSPLSPKPAMEPVSKTPSGSTLGGDPQQHGTRAKARPVEKKKDDEPRREEGRRATTTTNESKGDGSRRALEPSTSDKKRDGSRRPLEPKSDKTDGSRRPLESSKPCKTEDEPRRSAKPDKTKDSHRPSGSSAKPDKTRDIAVAAGVKTPTKHGEPPPTSTRRRRLKVGETKTMDESGGVKVVRKKRRRRAAPTPSSSSCDRRRGSEAAGVVRCQWRTKTPPPEDDGSTLS